MTIQQFANLVRKLRNVQKADGSGYKNATSKAESKSLEQKVDAAVDAILRGLPKES